MPTSESKIALGFRVHSGWAALVALSGSPVAPTMVDRRRVLLWDSDGSGPFQPYHVAAEMELDKAEAFIAACTEAAFSTARDSLGAALEHLRANHHSVAGCGILFGSGREPGSLAGILASHAMIHAAEGEFFRKALVSACEHYELPVSRVKERELVALAGNKLAHLAAMGKAAGPPWRQDEKYAALAAWTVLSSAGSLDGVSPVLPGLQ